MWGGERRKQSKATPSARQETPAEGVRRKKFGREGRTRNKIRRARRREGGARGEGARGCEGERVRDEERACLAERGTRSRGEMVVRDLATQTPSQCRPRHRKGVGRWQPHGLWHCRTSQTNCPTLTLSERRSISVSRIASTRALRPDAVICEVSIGHRTATQTWIR